MVATTFDTAREKAKAEYNMKLRRFMNQIFLVMALGVAITGVTSYIISSNPALMESMFHVTKYVDADGKSQVAYHPGLWWAVASVIELAMVWSMSSNVWKPARKRTLVGSLMMFLAYTILSGITLTPLIHEYTNTSLATVFFITTAMFGGFP